MERDGRNIYVEESVSNMKRFIRAEVICNKRGKHKRKEQEEHKILKEENATNYERLNI